MPHVESGPLAGMYLPDYGGASTVNLMSSIIGAAGGRSPHPGIDGLQAELRGADTILYLVVDGLGLHQLRRHLDMGAGQGFFANHPYRAISTVFPATTAAAITTFDTGASPAEHGILSWFLHLPDLGGVGTVLRTTWRNGTPMVPEGFDLQAYYRVPSYVQSVDAHLRLLSWNDIPHLPFAAVGTQWADSSTYMDLDGLVDAAVEFARHPGRGVSYVYWPRYDGVCHEVGCEHEDVSTHFDVIDTALGRLVEGLAGTNTALVVLADHGLVTVQRDNCIDLADVPGLMSCLAMAPSGDQRQMSVFVRPARVDRFLGIVRDELGEVVRCIEGQTLREAQAFGPGTPHPELDNRLGDYVLLCEDDHAIIHTPRGLEPLYMPGSHGGMSEREVQVPLFVVAC